MSLGYSGVMKGAGRVGIGMVGALVATASFGRVALAQAPGRDGPGGALGVGLVVGTPTGFTAEYRLSDAQALQFALGLDAFDHQDFYFHVTWRYYLVELAREADFSLPLYLGAGGFVEDQGAAAVGARAPIGLALDFSRAPVQIFGELALQLAFVNARGNDRLGVGGEIGFHYYF